MLVRHTAQTWNKQRAKILNFITRYGDRRITLATLHSLRALTNEQLQPGPASNVVPASIITISEQGKLMGVGYAIADGSGHCLIVVREDLRNQGIGSRIMQELIDSSEHFSCHVAIDNISSLALCFKNGLHAVMIFTGPTGKATLKFERSIHDDISSIRNFNPISQ